MTMKYKNYVKNILWINIFVFMLQMFKEGITENSDGLKGQFSFFQGNFWQCIATNTWIEIYGKEIIDGFEFIKFGETINAFVPASLITGQDSDGIKGQWSFCGIYRFECVAHNTWVKFAVQTVF